MRRKFSLLLVAILVLSFVGCREEHAQPEEPAEKAVLSDDSVCLTEGIASGSTEGKPVDDAFSEAYRKFAYELFQEAYQAGCSCISPYSVYEALAMTANGAANDTLSEMEKVLGMPTEECSAVLKTLREKYDSNDTIRISDSIWVCSKHRDTIRENFLQKCVDYYSADVLAGDFTSQKTVDDVNAWISAHTNKRIPKMIDGFGPNTEAVIINCLTFDGTWTYTFPEEKTEEEDFHCADGSVRPEMMMTGEADGVCDTEMLQGIKKQYENGYAFWAFIPKEGYATADVVDYLAKNDPKNIPFIHANDMVIHLPKMEVEADGKLNGALMNMGMKEAFDPGAADFSNLSETDLWIGDVAHEVRLSVSEKGTKAAAATKIELRTKSIVLRYDIRFDSPFVYMIMDSENSVPLFIGIYE